MFFKKSKYFFFFSDSTFLSQVWCVEDTNYACQIGSSLIISILKSIGLNIDEQVGTDFEFQCMP